jgi:D-alanyl-D-alanine carboxypeptidase
MVRSWISTFWKQRCNGLRREESKMPTPKSIRSLVALVACVLLVSAVNVAHATQADAAELVAKINELAKAEIKKPNCVGLSIGVVLDGKVILDAAYGLADVEHGVAATTNTPFRIGSITKQFAAAAVMRLVEQGKLSLDDEAFRFIPEFPWGDRRVTIRHLLTHTSGIANYTSLGEWRRRIIPLELTDAELLDLVKDAPFDFEPGERRTYSNTGYYMLGMIITRISEKHWDEFVRDDLARPAGLKLTFGDSNRAIIPNRARGYEMGPGGLRNSQLIGMSQPGAGGALLSTGGELVRWSLALAEGKIVSSESYAAMTTPALLNSGETTDYGFGLGIGAFEGRPTVSHGGGIPGFNSDMMHFSDEGVVVAVISNSASYGASGLARRIARMALGIEDVEIKDLELSEEEAAAFVGSFTVEQIDLSVRFFMRDGKLHEQVEGRPEFPMFHQGGGEFRSSANTEVRFVFDTTEAPSPSVTIYGSYTTLKGSRNSD